jgi:DNA polymerase (family 10)
LPVAKRLLEYVRSAPTVHRVSIAGSLRRWKEIVKDVDLLASADDAGKVMAHFVKAPGVVEVIGQGDTKSSVRLSSGMQIDLRVVTDAQFPYALAYFTGSKEHNILVRQVAQKKGLKVNEYGIFEGSKLIECTDEPGFYKILGLPYIPPEMRENTGELDYNATLQLLELKSLKESSTLIPHGATGWPRSKRWPRRPARWGCGTWASPTTARRPRTPTAWTRPAWRPDEGHRLPQQEVVGLPHPQGPGVRHPSQRRSRHDAEILGQLDFVIGSVHSRFDMPEAEMTERVCKAIANPHFDILGHATGRLLLSREGYKLDLGRVLEAARKHKKNRGVERLSQPS